MSLDLALFVEQAGWLAPSLQDPSRLGLITWLGRRLQSDAQDRFLRHFPLTHPAQVEGESALCALLQRAIVVHSSRLVQAHSVKRSIDWTATYANAFLRTRPPEPLLSRERHPLPDRASLGALVSLGSSWSRLLDLVDLDGPMASDYARRRTILRKAMVPQLLRGLAPTPFTSQHAARLRRLDDSAAKDVTSIQEALAFWRRTFGASGVSDSDVLSSLGRLLDDSAAKNIDTMLEATVALSIARAAVNAERADWPTLFPWSVLAIDDPKSRYPIIRLRSGDLICEIAKGTPACHVDGTRTSINDLLSPWADEVLRPTGRTRSTGRQPDLVVSFHFEGSPERSVFVLGDAKRNATGDGEAYLRASLDVAATYLMSFGYRMGLSVPTASGGPLKTELMPGVTLFCRQGAGREASSAIATLRADRAPVVMAFDVEKHLEPQTRPWHAPVLAAWLGTLGRQAVRALGPKVDGRRRRGAR